MMQKLRGWWLLALVTRVEAPWLHPRIDGANHWMPPPAPEEAP